MKIAQLIYTNGIAGAEKYLEHLLPGLRQYGIDCHLVVVCAAGAEKQLRSYCENMSRLGIPATLFISTKPGFIKTAGKINRYLRQNNIRYLHSHLLITDVLATLVKLCFNRKIIFISTKHGYRENILKKVISADDMASLKTEARRDPYYYVTRFTVKTADHNYAVSDAISKLFVNLGLSKTKMPFIHHGITVTASQRAVDDAVHYRLAVQQLVIVGRLEEFKGHRYLLQAMPLVVKKFPQCRLLIIGEGSDKKYLQELAKTLQIEEQVVFMGFQNNPYAYMQHSDVIVLPSLFEPFGLVYIEAFAIGTAVVAFDTAAGNEIMENNVTALLATAGDSKELADKIIYLLEHPAEAAVIKDRAYKHYKENFSTERMVKDTAAYYNAIEQEPK